MKPADEKPEDLATEQYRSATRSPPRSFVCVFKGKLMHGLPMTLRVELSDDARILYFTLTDPNRGTPSPTFQRIDGLLEARVRAAFPGLGVTHEAKSSEPIWSLPP